MQTPAAALSLAGKAGIPVAPWRIETIAGRATLLERRYDREGTVRIPFLQL
jgi:serine/threonine-protein kinase HipA